MTNHLLTNCYWDKFLTIITPNVNQQILEVLDLLDHVFKTFFQIAIVFGFFKRNINKWPFQIDLVIIFSSFDYKYITFYYSLFFSFSRYPMVLLDFFHRMFFLTTTMMVNRIHNNSSYFRSKS